MRIYKPLLWSLFVVQFIYSVEKIKFDIPDSVFIKQTLDSIILAENSIALKYAISRYDNEFKNITYQPFYISDMIDTIVINSNNSIKQSYLKHIFKNFSNFKIDKETRNNIEKKKKMILNKYYFIRSAPRMSIGKYEGDKLGILVDIDPNFNNYFSGLFGGSKAQEDRWQYNGEIDLHFENVWGSMEKLIFKWRAIDSTNQEFNFELHKPHLLLSGMGLILKSNYELVNNNYFQDKYELKLELLNSFYGSYYVGYNQGSINATESGQEIGFVSSNYKALSFMFRNNSLNSMIMPRKGSKTNFELEIGRGSELENLYIRYKQNSEMYVAISKYLNSCFKFYGEHIKAIDNDVGKAREILFGGVSSLRGYEDNSFSTSSVLIPSFEFHYNGLNSINALFFFESGFSKDYSPKISYGLGAKKITNNALINIEFALPYKSPINEGKVHIKWLTRL